MPVIVTTLIDLPTLKPRHKFSVASHVTTSLKTQTQVLRRLFWLHWTTPQVLSIHLPTLDISHTNLLLHLLTSSYNWPFNLDLMYDMKGLNYWYLELLDLRLLHGVWIYLTGYLSCCNSSKSVSFKLRTGFGLFQGLDGKWTKWLIVSKNNSTRHTVLWSKIPELGQIVHIPSNSLF